MFWLPNGFDSLQLDVVGIVAILGEGSVSRNAQVLGLSWHPLLPRLMPAPQAMIRHEREKRLPAQRGIVVGAYSGNLWYELNWFSQLLHPDELHKNEVEIVEVKKRPGYENSPPYTVNHHGWLAFLSVLGFLISGTLIGLSVHYSDGFALIAVGVLSLTSSTVGVASKWTLEFEEEKPKEDRKQIIPDGDVVIYYPRQGAFRVVRCNEVVSRLYFKTEGCEPLLSDSMYRLAAVTSTVLLILGLICLGNARPILQCSFAGSYVVLNVAYWAVSALNPLDTHWYHSYSVDTWKAIVPGAALTPVATTASSGTLGGSDAAEDAAQENRPTNLTFATQGPDEASQKEDTEAGIIPNPSDAEGTLTKTPLLKRVTSEFTKRTLRRQTSIRPDIPQSQRNYTTALWTTIALTKSIRWLDRTHIAPDSDVWNDWLAVAVTEAQKPRSTKKDTRNKTYILPDWDYQNQLNIRFAEQPEQQKRRPTWPTLEELRRHGLLDVRQGGRNARPDFGDVAFRALHQSRSGGGLHSDQPQATDGGITVDNGAPSTHTEARDV